jgi:putative transcriptional regulator
MPVLAGGPVEPGRGFVLHEADYAASRHDPRGRCLGLHLHARHAAGHCARRWAEALAHGVGYAGWGAGQLDMELRQHGWHIAPGDAACVWDVAAEKRWERAFALTGVAVANLVGNAGPGLTRPGATRARPSHQAMMNAFSLLPSGSRK